MQMSAARLVSAIVVAAAGIYLGVRLAIFSEADDAPGGVVIAMFLIFLSVGLATWIAFRRSRKASPNNG